MQFYIHTGTYKTGTTAIQNMCFYNRELLITSGIFYGNVNKYNNNHIAFAYGVLKRVLKKMDLLEQYHTHPLMKEVAQDPEELLEKMVSDAKYHGCNRILISHEGIFHELFRTLRGLEAGEDTALECKVMHEYKKYLKNVIQKAAGKEVSIKIVTYLRRQDEYLESEYNQFVKCPWYNAIQIPTFEEYLTYKPMYLKYHEILRDWSDIFGIDAQMVRVYEKEQLKKGLLFDFFCEVLGLSDAIFKQMQPVPKEESNVRLGRNAVTLKQKLRKCHFALDQAVVKYANTHIDPDYAYFTEEERKNLLEQCESGNREVAKIYLKRDGKLFFDETYPKEIYPGLDENQMLEMMEWINEELSHNIS